MKRCLSFSSVIFYQKYVDAQAYMEVVDPRLIQFELRNFKYVSQKSVIVIFAEYMWYVCLFDGV
jgi:hypothetical protein